MASKALKVFARRFVESLGVAEKAWKQAKKVATENAHPGLESAYAMGVVRNRLGLEGAELLFSGAPVDSLLIEKVVFTEKPIKLNRFETLCCSVAVSEMAKAESGQKSTVAVKNSFGDATIRASFKDLAERRLSEMWSIEELKKLLPGVDVSILKMIVQEAFSSKSEEESVE